MKAVGLAPQCLAVLVLALPSGLAAHAQGAGAVHADVLLQGGTIYDGSGAEPQVGDVALVGQRIIAVGRFEVGKVRRTISCAGLVVAPGFIDLHTHSDGALNNPQARRSLNYLLQGCTTVITGSCGSGPVDAGKYFAAIDRQGFGTNVIHLVPHGAVRAAVMGSAQRAPTAVELEKMKDKVDEAMRQGAWGISTGLIYLPGTYAKTEELVELAKVVSAHRGMYVTHLRDEGDRLLEAVREAIEIGRQAKVAVHISHFKASGKLNWGRIRDAAQLIDEARREGIAVTADQYPYTASSTSLLSTLLEAPKVPGGVGNLTKRMASDAQLDRLVREMIRQRLPRSAKIVIAQCAKHPEWTGKSLAQIAAAIKVDEVEAAVRVLRDGGASVVNHGMSEDDVRAAMLLPWVATGSDGSARVPKADEKPHPRSYGTFPRKVGRYAIREKHLGVAQAIRSCTGLSADLLGLKDRGYLKAGAYADVLVFDPEQFLDQATFDKPDQYATGVRYLFINGRPAIDDGKPTEPLCGRAIRHAGEPARVQPALGK